MEAIFKLNRRIFMSVMYQTKYIFIRFRISSLLPFANFSFDANEGHADSITKGLTCQPPLNHRPLALLARGA